MQQPFLQTKRAKATARNSFSFFFTYLEWNVHFLCTFSHEHSHWLLHGPQRQHPGQLVPSLSCRMCHRGSQPSVQAGAEPRHPMEKSVELLFEFNVTKLVSFTLTMIRAYFYSTGGLYVLPLTLIYSTGGLHVLPLTLIYSTGGTRCPPPYFNLFHWKDSMSSPLL